MWVRFPFSTCNMVTSLQLVSNSILLITLLNECATPGTVTNRISSKAEVTLGSPWSGVVWKSTRWWGAASSICNRYNSCSPPILPGSSICALFANSTSVFPHQIDSYNPIMTLSASDMHIIPTATETYVLPRLISSPTSALGISEYKTHLLTINHTVQTWCSRNVIPGSAGGDCWLPGTWSACDWWLGWAFSCLTASL